MTLCHYRGVDVEVDEGVYEPSDDTFMAIDAVLGRGAGNASVLEIGTGTGLAAVIIARDLAPRWIVAVDIDPKAVACARRNIEANDADVNILQGDLFGPVDDERFDIILFNPPYLPFELGEGAASMALDGGPEGGEMTGRFLEALPRYLENDGHAYLVVSSLSHGEALVGDHMRRGRIFAERIDERSFPFEKLFVYDITIPHRVVE